jgi:hypothetical protein
VKIQKRHLSVKLNDDEIAKAGKQLSNCCLEILNEADNQSTAKAEMKQRMNALVEQRTRLSFMVARGEDTREVEVKLEVVTPFIVRETRTDTGEVIAERPPTNEERQIEFGDEDDGQN